MPKSRTAQWVAVGIVLVLVLSITLTALAMRGRIATAAGLDRPAASPTVHPSVFEAPSASPTPPSVGNLQPPAAVTTPSPAPSKQQLVQRLAQLDTSKLATPDGKPATISWELLDGVSGQPIASRDAHRMLIPASNTKTLTITSVLNAFNGDETFATTVTQPSPGTIVLVGGGDPLLASEAAQPGTYPQPASLRSLAQQTAKALRAAGTTSVTLGYDASYFPASGWAPTWPAKYRDQVTPISALWADEGKVDGARQADPAAAAAAIFARQLGEEGVQVSGAPAVAKGTGEEIASVASLPVHALAQQAMLRSNNSFTEALGFQLAKHTGHPATFAGATAAIEQQLTKLGIWEKSAHLDDASGLSRSNKVSAAMLARANHHIITDARLTAVMDGLPVAGVTGTLRERFTDDISAPALGVARAKTGTLSLVSSLSGYTTTADGSLVVFAIVLNGQVDGWAAKVLEDQVVGTVTGCGC